MFLLKLAPNELEMNELEMNVLEEFGYMGEYLKILEHIGISRACFRKIGYRRGAGCSQSQVHQNR